MADVNTTMPVAPMGGNGAFGGDSWAWIIILLLAFGGMGNGFGGNGNNLYPWLNNSDQMAAGFANQTNTMFMNNLSNSITSGFGDLQTALCGGFAGVTNGFSQAEIAANGRQMANMQQLFGITTAIAELKSTLMSEACETRTTSTANTQRILDALSQQTIAAKDDRINDLERQLGNATLAASQTAQTAAIIDAIRAGSTAA